MIAFTIWRIWKHKNTSLSRGTCLSLPMSRGYNTRKNCQTWRMGLDLHRRSVDQQTVRFLQLTPGGGVADSKVVLDITLLQTLWSPGDTTRAWDNCSKLSLKPVWDHNLPEISWQSPLWPDCARHIGNGHDHAFVSWVALVTLYASSLTCSRSCGELLSKSTSVGTTKTITTASRDKSKKKPRQTEID